MGIMAGTQVIWDLDDELTGNVQHVAQHGVTKAEVEDVVQQPGMEIEESQSTGNPCAFGWTSTGKHLIVVFELVSSDPLVIYPITAYEVPPPA